MSYARPKAYKYASTMTQVLAHAQLFMLLLEASLDASLGVIVLQTALTLGAYALALWVICDDQA